MTCVIIPVPVSFRHFSLRARKLTIRSRRKCRVQFGFFIHESAYTIDIV